ARRQTLTLLKNSAREAGLPTRCSAERLTRAQRAFFQYGNRRQHFAFHEFEKRTAAGGDVRDLIGHAVFVDGGQRITTTGDGKCSAVRNGIRQFFGTVAEAVHFKHAHRAVPQNGFGRFQHVSELSRGFRAYVQNHVVVADIGHFLNHRLGGVNEGHKVVDRAGDFRNHHVGRQRHIHFGGNGFGGVDQIVFAQGFTHFKTRGGQEGV